MRKVLKYWAAHNIYKKIQRMIDEKIKAGPTNAPGNPANIAMNQAVTEFATLESKHMDVEPKLNKLNVSPEIKKWKAVYRLGQQLNRFVEEYGKGAIWVIPFNALEAAFSRSLDSANAIYITVVLDFLTRNEEVGNFIKNLGKRTRDTFVPLSRAEPMHRLTRLAEMEKALEAFAIEIKLAKSQAPLNVVAPGSIIEMSETALRSAFMSEGSEAMYLRSSSPKTFMHAKDIEYLKPGEYLSDSIIDLTLKMVKSDQYYIVESAAFERIFFERDTAFWDDNDKDAQMGYIIPMHIDLAHDDESDNDDADTDTEKDAEEDTHGFNHKNGHLSHHFVLVYIRRSSPLPAQDYVVQIYDSLGGQELNHKAKRVIEKTLPSGANVNFTYPQVPRQKDSHSCGLHVILHSISIMRYALISEGSSEVVYL